MQKAIPTSKVLSWVLTISGKQLRRWKTNSTQVNHTPLRIAEAGIADWLLWLNSPG